MCRVTQLVVFLLFLCGHVCSYNILAIVSLPLKSHYMAFGELFRELASRGHAVTVVNNFPDEQTIPNLKFIQLKEANTRANHFPKLETYEDFDSRLLPLYNFYRHMANPEIIETDCDNLLSNAQIQSLKGNKYDVIFVEQFMSDCALAFAGEAFQAPIIGIASHVLLPWAYPRLGLPFNAAADAFYFASGGPNPFFVDKLQAYLYHHFFNSIGRWLVQRPIYGSFQKYLPNYDLDIERLAQQRMKMVFSYQHFSFTGARVLAPQVLEIAGLHVKKPKALPKDIETFLNGAEQGAVYVGFGSNLKLSTISERKLKEFLGAFKRILPLKVLLQWDNGTIEDENVFTRGWFPQLDVLCHPKVVAFVSHGGMLGSSEAASCGVPMVVVPFFGDQFGNAAMLKASGLGTVLNLEHITGETLSGAIREVTSQTTQKRAKEISELWHDRPLSAVDSAVYWTEYVAKHPGSPPSLPTKTSSWLEPNLFDVYVAAVVLSLMILLVVYSMFKVMLAIVIYVFRKCLSSKEKGE